VTDSANVPVAGSLEAKIIRACAVHKNCGTSCPERKVEELGEIASFDLRRKPSLIQRIGGWFRPNTPGGG